MREYSHEQRLPRPQLLLLTLLRRPHAHLLSRERVEAFFKETRTPVDRSSEHKNEKENDRRQHFVLGNLCFAYGSLTLLLLAVPNSMSDRILILICGGFVVLVGIVLRLVAAKAAKTRTEVTKQALKAS